METSVNFFKSGKIKELKKKKEIHSELNPDMRLLC